MTAGAGPVLKQLHQQYGDRVDFLTLYVREAHPGDRYPQPQDEDRKMAHARDYRARDGLPWPVAVDDVDGTLHRALDPKPSSVYIMDADGRVAFRALWSNDLRTIRDGLADVADGRTPASPERLNRILPMTDGLGRQFEILQLAGDQAKRDVLRQLPPMYAMARLAGALRPLPPIARGAIAQMLPVLALALVWSARRRLRGDG